MKQEYWIQSHIIENIRKRLGYKMPHRKTIGNQVYTDLCLSKYWILITVDSRYLEFDGTIEKKNSS